MMDPKQTTVVNFLASTLAWVFLIVVFLISKRWADAFLYLLPVHRILISGLFLVGQPALDLSVYTFDNQKQLLIEGIYFVIAYMIDITMLSPSLVFSALIYGPIYAIMHLI